ncbi:MAG: MarR family winged helix-turn-helix transcriptional regulator [Pseudomonadota bacterium]
MTQNENIPAREIICDDVLIAIRRINQSVDLHSRYLVRHFGLTGPQLIILQVIFKKKEISINEIAKTVSLGQPTVTGILERLENRGLIIRRRSNSDKRKVFISITATCQELMKKAPPPMQEHFINSFSSLQDWEQSMILASLQRIVSLMDAKSIQVAPILATGSISEAPEKFFEQDASFEENTKEKSLSKPKHNKNE